MPFRRHPSRSLLAEPFSAPCSDGGGGKSDGMKEGATFNSCSPPVCHLDRSTAQASAIDRVEGGV